MSEKLSISFFIVHMSSVWWGTHQTGDFHLKMANLIWWYDKMILCSCFRLNKYKFYKLVLYRFTVLSRGLRVHKSYHHHRYYKLECGSLTLKPLNAKLWFDWAYGIIAKLEIFELRTHFKGFAMSHAT